MCIKKKKFGVAQIVLVDLGVPIPHNIVKPTDNMYYFPFINTHPSIFEVLQHLDPILHVTAKGLHS